MELDISQTDAWKMSKKKELKNRAAFLVAKLKLTTKEAMRFAPRKGYHGTDQGARRHHYKMLLKSMAAIRKKIHKLEDELKGIL